MYSIKLECSAAALAELIKMGLEQRATIVEIKDADDGVVENKPTFNASNKVSLEPIRPDAQVMPLYQNPTQHKSRAGYKQQMNGWDLYSMILDLYHPQKTFTSADLHEACHRYGMSCTRKSASSHMTRLRKMNLAKAVGKDVSNGYIYETMPPVDKSDYFRLVKNYNKTQVNRERNNSAVANQNQSSQWQELRRKFGK